MRYSHSSLPISISRIGVLQIAFQDMTFLICRATHYTTFLKICGLDIPTATCLNRMTGGKQGHAFLQIFSHHQILFLLPEFRDHKTITKLVQIWTLLFWG